MNNQAFSKIWIIVILVVLIVGGILIWQYWWMPREKAPTIGPKEGITINEDAIGVPSSPMDLILSISPFSEERIAEITVKIGKSKGYSTEWFNARNVNAEIQLPEGLKLIEGDLKWQGDISGDEIAEFKAKVKAIYNGEWKVEASASTKNLPPYESVGDSERFYVLVSDEEVLVSDRSFTKPTPEEKAEAGMAIIPEEFMIYQDYIRATDNYIRGVGYDVATIEATVISLTRTEVCPDTTAEDIGGETPVSSCSIEPYPKDTGMVRIDRIIEYTPYLAREKTIEEPAEIEGQSEGEGEFVPGSPDPEGEAPKKEYEPLKEGQEVFTRFRLTIRPVKVRYVSIPPTEGGEESIPLSAPLESESEHSGEEPVEVPIGEEPVEHPIEPGAKIYKPIPKENNYFVFTTKIIEYPATSQKILPGLGVGSKFHAEIYYNGTLYVEEYEVMQ